MVELEQDKTQKNESEIQHRWWRSNLLWRLVFAVFITIVAVQVIVFAFSMERYKKTLETQLLNNSYAAIASIMNTRADDKKSDLLTPDEALQLIKSSWITGVEMRSFEGKQLKAYGETLSLPAGTEQKMRMDDDWARYEFELDRTSFPIEYQLVVRVNASILKTLLQDYVRHSVYLFIVLAVLITLVLNLIISRSILRPIITLRRNLFAASQDPENAEKYMTAKGGDNEVAIIIEAANDLIEQNAHNLIKMKRQARETIHQLAYYDTLTGLPNRGLYLQELEQALAENRSDDKKIAVCVIDLDHFKDINDTMGHQAGDFLLTAIGKRLREYVSPDLYVARSGEDEFSVFGVFNQDDDIDEMVVLPLQQAMSESFDVKGQHLTMRISLGVSHFPKDGAEASVLLKNADIALNKAKNQGRGIVYHYSSDLQDDITGRFQLISALRQAIQKDELELFYQPQFSLTKGEANICGAEALIRWFRFDEETQEKVFVSPADFIPLAEESGLIIPIGEWVLETACRQAVVWCQEDHMTIPVAVNISALQFQHPNFVDMVKAALEKTGIDPRYLELELTESVFAGDIEKSISVLQELKELGITLAIDDFGTGYSCLSYLSKFPIDRLKIDQSFVRHALDNYEDSAIIKTIIKLGHSLKMNVIAEGVETSEHEAFLKAQECYYVQGYHYSRPLNVYDFSTFIQDHKKQESA